MPEDLPAVKRRRVSDNKNSFKSGAIHRNTIHERFTRWCQDRGVVINNVKASAIPNRGMGLVTTAAIKKDERVAFVPEKAMFKPDTALIHREQKAQRLSREISPQAQLAVSLLAHDENGKADSSIALWRQTWPTMHDLASGMPLFWEEEIQQSLPPSITQPLARQKADFKRDLDAVAKFTSLHMRKAEERDPLAYYWAIVNSRSFHFKPPGARPGFMVLCPFIDYMNHSPSGPCLNVFQSPQGYEVIADRDYDIGEEIFVTYGAHSNEKLLIHYGFMCDVTPGEPSDDDIRLDHILLPEIPAPIKQQLQDTSFLGTYVLAPATLEICFRTQVAIRAVLCSANEWEYFIANGEDLGEDYSSSVEAWLRPLLTIYLGDTEEKISDFEREAETRNKDKSRSESKPEEPSELEAAEHNERPHVLILERWRQIGNGLRAFLKRRQN